MSIEELDNFLNDKDIRSAFLAGRASTSQKKFAMEAYEVFLKKGISKKCNDGYRDAFLLLNNKFNKKNIAMEICKYILKPGVVIKHEGRFYNNNSLTDEIAEAWLAATPNGADRFSHVLSAEQAAAAPPRKPMPKIKKKSDPVIATPEDEATEEKNEETEEQVTE